MVCHGSHTSYKGISPLSVCNILGRASKLGLIIFGSVQTSRITKCYVIYLGHMLSPSILSYVQPLTTEIDMEGNILNIFGRKKI